MYKILENIAKQLAQSSENPILHIPYRLFVARSSGYKYQTPPDFNTGIFGWFDYKPVGKSNGLQPVSIKDQSRLNNCVYQSTIGAKEIDEGVELSVKSITIYAKIKGLLSGDGWSSTENGEKALRDFGACLEKDFPSNEEAGWDKYSDTRQLTPALMEKAKEYRSQTFWSVKSRGDRLKLLDEKKPIKVAIQWYTGYNQGGGFKAPWIISKRVGLPVGGHQFYVIDYIMGYYGQNVYVCVNSYGDKWGDKGKFYVTMDFLDREAWTSTANLDIERPIADFITQYAQMVVKGSQKPAIYYIAMGKKRVFTDPVILATWGYSFADVITVPQQELDRIPEGEPMKAESSPHYPLYKQLKKPLETIQK
jgi:hypothetical protein